MEWINPKIQLPPQGKKILYFKNGDIYVVQRYGDLWLPLPFYDSKFAFHNEPDLWADIIPPVGFTGKVFVMPVDKEPISIDDLEKDEPELYHEMVEAQRKMWMK